MELVSAVGSWGYIQVAPLQRPLEHDKELPSRGWDRKLPWVPVFFRGSQLPCTSRVGMLGLQSGYCRLPSLGYTHSRWGTGSESWG